MIWCASPKTVGSGFKNKIIGQVIILMNPISALCLSVCMCVPARWVYSWRRSSSCWRRWVSPRGRWVRRSSSRPRRRSATGCHPRCHWSGEKRFKVILHVPAKLKWDAAEAGWGLDSATCCRACWGLVLQPGGHRQRVLAGRAPMQLLPPSRRAPSAGWEGVVGAVWGFVIFGDFEEDHFRFRRLSLSLPLQSLQWTMVACKSNPRRVIHLLFRWYIKKIIIEIEIWCCRRAGNCRFSKPYNFPHCR